MLYNIIVINDIKRHHELYTCKQETSLYRVTYITHVNRCKRIIT